MEAHFCGNMKRGTHAFLEDWRTVLTLSALTRAAALWCGRTKLVYHVYLTSFPLLYVARVCFSSQTFREREITEVGS